MDEAGGGLMSVLLISHSTVSAQKDEDPVKETALRRVLIATFPRFFSVDDVRRCCSLLMMLTVVCAGPTRGAPLLLADSVELSNIFFFLGDRPQGSASNGIAEGVP